jgi:hypothetical protein
LIGTWDPVTSTCKIAASTAPGVTPAITNIFAEAGTYTAASGTPGNPGYVPASGTNPCVAVTVAKQGGTGVEFAIEGTYVSGGTPICTITAVAGFSLESVCGSFEYVKSSETSGSTNLQGLTAEWR